MIQAQAMAAAVAIYESEKSDAVSVIREYGLAILLSVKDMVTSCPGPVEMSGEPRHESSSLWPQALSGTFTESSYRLCRRSNYGKALWSISTQPHAIH
jgi:hypothetical protein